MYYQIYKNILQPLHEKVVKRRKMLDYREFLEESQWWPREKLLDFQWQELKKLLDHVYIQVPYWREKFKTLGMTPDDVRGYKDFERLPRTTKQDIREHKDRMIADNYRGKLWSKFTSGSTGLPLVLEYTPDSFDWRVAGWKRSYAWAGCEDGMRQFWLWGAMMGKSSALKKFKEGLHYAFMQKKYFICHGMDDEAKAECIEEINRYRPDFIVAYTNPLFAVAQFVIEKGGLKHKPRGILTGAEKLYEVQRKTMERAFGCKIFNTYGCREVMLIGSECEEQKGLHLTVENLLVETLHEDGSVASPGEKGEVVVTDLHNFGMPLIRYVNEDIGVLSSRQSCPCGRGLPLMEDVVGRSLDMITTPEGKDISGEFFAIVMLDKIGVERYRVTQERLDYILIEIMKNEKFTEQQFQTIKEQIAKVVPLSVKLEYRFVDDMPVSQTGKFRLTVSKIGQNEK